MKKLSDVRLTLEQEVIKMNSEIYKTLLKNVDGVIDHYKIHLAKKLNLGLPFDSDSDSDSDNNDEEQAVSEGTQNIESAFKKDEIGALLLSFKDNLIAGLTKKITQCFKFEFATSLLHACLNKQIISPFKEEILNICHQQFYTVLFIKVDYLILHFRKKTSLFIQANNSDPLNTNPIGKLLLLLQGCVKSGLKSAKQPFNFATLIELFKLYENDNFFVEIKNVITEIYQIIINDILNYKESLSAHFNYQEIDCESAVALLTSIINGPHLHAIGPATWRICCGLKQNEGEFLVKKHRDIINTLKNAIHFQSYDPFEQNPHILFAHIIEKPWMIAFFTRSHLLNFFIHASSNTNTQIIETINMLKKSQALQSFSDNVSDEALQIGKSLFTIPLPDEKETPPQPQLLAAVKNLFSTSVTPERGNTIKFPMFSAVQRNKKAIAYFLAINALYSKSVINDTITSRDFICLNGVFRELMPLLTPSTIVELFLEFDNHVPNKTNELIDEKRKQGIDIKISAQIARGFVEFEWLLTRIENDIKQNLSIDEYCNKTKKIPYVLYELALRETFLQLPSSNLATIFAVIAPETLLGTLQLLDPQHKLNEYIHLNKKIQGNITTSDQYEVDKTTTLAIFQKFVQILLNDEFNNIRHKWSEDTKALPLLIAYPFLLKDIEFHIIEHIIALHKEKILSNAYTCLGNAINPFVHCPSLLAFLSAEDIINLYNKYPIIRGLFKDKKLIPEVICHYIKNKSFEMLVKNIPELNNYLDDAFFEKANKQLLNEQLLLAMINPNSETTRMALRNYPLITERFDQNIIAICAAKSAFLRQILRQTLFLHIIDDIFDDLLNFNIVLLKHMVKVLYSNRASNSLLEKIRKEIIIIHDDLVKRYDPEKEKNLIIIAKNKYEFSDVTPYLSERIFDEQQNLDEILSPSQQRRNYDPIVLVIHDLIISYPSRVRQIIQSKGVFPALKEYCLHVLAKAADDKKRINDHYPAILLYASLLIEEKKEYEEAAEYLEEYIEYLGLSKISANLNPSVYDLLINCADGLMELSCDQQLQNKDPDKALYYQNKSLYYYYYLATALLAADNIKRITYKLPLQCLETNLPVQKQQQLTPAINILNAVRQQQQIIIHFARKTIELMQKNHLEKQTLLALMSLVYALLLKTENASHYSCELLQQSISLKSKLLSLSSSIFNKTYPELVKTIEPLQAIVESHVVYKTFSSTKLYLPSDKKNWSKLDEDIILEQQFLNNLNSFYKYIHKMISSNSINPIHFEFYINELLSLLQSDIDVYNNKHHYLLSSFLDSLKHKIAIHNELVTNGIFTTLRQHHQNDSNVQAKQNKPKKLIDNTNTSTTSEKKIFSPYSRVKLLHELQELFEALFIIKQKQNYPKGRLQISAYLNQNKPINTQVTLTPISASNDDSNVSLDSEQPLPTISTQLSRRSIRPSFNKVFKSEVFQERASIDRTQEQLIKKGDIVNFISANTVAIESTPQLVSTDAQPEGHKLLIETIIDQEQSIDDISKQKRDKKAKKLEKKEKKEKKLKMTKNIEEGQIQNERPNPVAPQIKQQLHDNSIQLQSGGENQLQQQADEMKKYEEENLHRKEEINKQEQQYRLDMQKEAEEAEARKQKEKAELLKAKQDAIEKARLKEQQRKELNDKKAQDLKLAEDEFAKAKEQAQLKEQQLRASRDNKQSDTKLAEEELANANELSRLKEERLKALNDKKAHDKSLADAAMKHRLQRSLSVGSLTNKAPIKNIATTQITTPMKKESTSITPTIEQQNKDIDKQLNESKQRIKKTEQEIAAIELEDQRLAKEEQEILRKMEEFNKKTKSETEDKNNVNNDNSTHKLKRSTSVGNLQLTTNTSLSVEQSATDKDTSSSHGVIKRALFQGRILQLEEEERKRKAEKEALARRVEERTKAREQQNNKELGQTDGDNSKSSVSITNISDQQKTQQLTKEASHGVAEFSGIFTKVKDQPTTSSSSNSAESKNQNSGRIAQAGVTMQPTGCNKVPK